MIYQLVTLLSSDQYGRGHNDVKSYNPRGQMHVNAFCPLLYYSDSRMRKLIIPRDWF